jgi:nitrite reductase (NO-forming)
MFAIDSRFVRTRTLRLVGLGLFAATCACAPLFVQETVGPSGVGQPVTAPAKLTSPPQADVASQIHVTAREFRFDPSSIQVAVGQPVTLVLDNAGTIQHNLQIEGRDDRLVASPGQTAKATVEFDTPGEYTYVCTIPGHKEAGMRGKLLVGDAQATTATHHADLSAPAPASSTASAAAQLPDIQALPADVARLPLPQVAPPVNRNQPAVVRVDLETREATALLADGIAYRFWTFNGTVPGPMVRVRQGDTVELHLSNLAGTAATHSINLHAVSGPGGGAWATQVEPGSDGSIRFTATHPGVYVYHCMTPPVGQHVANGMYGMIVVEPPEGLAPVDHEWYVMQGDFYLQGDRDTPGLRAFSMDKLMAEQPDYVVYNGSVGALTGPRALRARVGETVRIFFGVGGPAMDSAFHIVGGIFDRLHPDGASEYETNVQTTLVPPGDAVMAELKFDAPGHYMIEDHHITRLQKGAMADIEVDGPDQPQIFFANR